MLAGKERATAVSFNGLTSLLPGNPVSLCSRPARGLPTRKRATFNDVNTLLHACTRSCLRRRGLWFVCSIVVTWGVDESRNAKYHKQRYAPIRICRNAVLCVYILSSRTLLPPPGGFSRVHTDRRKGNTRKLIISPPSFCGSCLDVYRERGSGLTCPRRLQGRSSSVYPRESRSRLLDKSRPTVRGFHG